MVVERYSLVGRISGSCDKIAIHVISLNSEYRFLSESERCAGLFSCRYCSLTE